MRAGLGRLGRARSSMGSRLGPEMTSRYHGNRDIPEMEKKSRDTLMDRFKQHFNGFFTCLVVAEHCPCPTRRELLGCSRRDTIGRCWDRRRFVSFGFLNGF